MKHERKLILANFDKAQGCIEIGLIINFFLCKTEVLVTNPLTEIIKMYFHLNP